MARSGISPLLLLRETFRDENRPHPALSRKEKGSDSIADSPTSVAPSGLTAVDAPTPGLTPLAIDCRPPGWMARTITPFSRAWRLCVRTFGRTGVSRRVWWGSLAQPTLHYCAATVHGGGHQPAVVDGVDHQRAPTVSPAANTPGWLVI